MADEIDMEEVAARLVRALRLDSVMHDAERSALRARVLWPAYAYDRGDLNNQVENAAYLRQLEADAARRREWDNRPARDDYLEVMGWLVEMGRVGDRRKRGKRGGRQGRSNVAEHVAEFTRRVALDWDWASIARWEHGVARPTSYQVEKARGYWVWVVSFACEIVNGRAGELYLAPGVPRVRRAGRVEVRQVEEVG